MYLCIIYQPTLTVNVPYLQKVVKLTPVNVEVLSELDLNQSWIWRSINPIDIDYYG